MPSLLPTLLNIPLQASSPLQLNIPILNLPEIPTRVNLANMKINVSSAFFALFAASLALDTPGKDGTNIYKREDGSHVSELKNKKIYLPKRENNDTKIYKRENDWSLV